MQKKKGLVMETSREGYITVMTSQGEFLRVPWPKASLPGIGCEVEFVPAMKKKTFFRQRYFIALAACVALILLFTPVWLGQLPPAAHQIVAYVNVDINPSLELGINSQGIVMEANGLNEDGKKLLEKMELFGLPVEEAIEKITTQAVEAKYLSPEKENTVLITVSCDTAPPVEVKNLESGVKKVLQQSKITAQAETLEVPADIRKIAKKENISAGKYALFIEALAEGVDVTIEDLKESSVIEAVKEAGGNPGQLIAKAKKDRDRFTRMHEEQRDRYDMKEQEKKNKDEEKERWKDNRKEEQEREKENREEEREWQKENKEEEREREKENKEKNKADWKGLEQGKKRVFEQVKEKYEKLKSQLEKKWEERKKQRQERPDGKSPDKNVQDKKNDNGRGRGNDDRNWPDSRYDGENEKDQNNKENSRRRNG